MHNDSDVEAFPTEDNEKSMMFSVTFQQTQRYPNMKNQFHHWITSHQVKPFLHYIK